MTVYDEILVELRAMRVTLDKIAARVVSDQTREELMPVWTCGHRHASRREALECPLCPPDVLARSTGQSAKVGVID